MEPLVAFLRRSRAARRGLSALAVLLFVSAVGLLGYPVYTNLYQDRTQARLDRQIASAEHVERYKTRRVEEGDALTRLKIPALDVEVVVVEGTSASALRAGAGHYPKTSLPCETRQRRHRRSPHDLRATVLEHRSAQARRRHHPRDAPR